MKYLWSVQCKKCSKEIYNVKILDTEKYIPRGFIYGFNYYDYKCVVPINYQNFGIYNIHNRDWKCYDCKYKLYII